MAVAALTPGGASIDSEFDTSRSDLVGGGDGAGAGASRKTGAGISEQAGGGIVGGGMKGRDGADNDDADYDDDNEDDDDMSHVTSEGDSGEFDLGFKTEEEIIANLEQRVANLEAEKAQVVAVNNDLQKKAVALLVREKLVQGQGQAVTHKQSTSTTDAAAAAAGGAAGGGGDPAIDHASERERQLQETYQQIVENRVKLERQQTEFDQLALDLQTRLDDKEFKAGEIGESFKAFKRCEHC
jgi:hypothetical protein